MSGNASSHVPRYHPPVGNRCNSRALKLYRRHRLAEICGRRGGRPRIHMGRRTPPTPSRLGQATPRPRPRHMRLHRRLSRTFRPLPHRHPRRRRLAPRPRHRTQARRRRPRLHTVVQAMQPASRSMDDQPPHRGKSQLVGVKQPRRGARFFRGPTSKTPPSRFSPPEF